MLGGLIFLKVKKQYTLPEVELLLAGAFARGNRGLMMSLLLLMGLNWGIEALKWKLLVKPVQPVTLFTAGKAVLSGLSFSIFIPNGVGEYIGRTLHISEGNRLRSLPLSMVGSIAQLITTLAAGTAGLLYLTNSVLQVEGLPLLWLNGLLYAVIVAIIFLLVIFFNISWFTKWFEKIPLVRRYQYFFVNLETFERIQLTQILLLSIIRYAVFIVQYFIAFQLFNVHIHWVQAAFAVSVLFLLLAVIPIVPGIAELGVRSQLSTQLFGLLSANTVGIVFSAAIIWIVNLIIPALAGTLFIISIKLFRNK